jgi:hypothetical protein
MRAEMVEALTPLALASWANSCFQSSKPAALLPHWAALAVWAAPKSDTKAVTAAILYCQPLVICIPSTSVVPDETLPDHPGQVEA